MPSRRAFLRSSLATAGGLLLPRRLAAAARRIEEDFTRAFLAGLLAQFGFTPLLYATMAGDQDTVRVLLDGTLTNEAVFSSQGHGALFVEPGPFEVDVVAVTGPQRERMLPALRAAGLPRVHAAAPHGYMMIAGCFGLLDGFAYRVPEAREAVERLHR